MGSAKRWLCSLHLPRHCAFGAIITSALTISVFAEFSISGTKTGNFNALGLRELELSAEPDLRRLNAQGNLLNRLDVSGNAQLDRLLLFGNSFGREGMEELLFSLNDHSARGGFLGLSDLRKQTLSLGGRLNLATLRSRNWSVPTPGQEQHFGFEARTFLWSSEPLTTHERESSWSYGETADPLNARDLPLAGFSDDAPRWFHATAPDGFYSVTSIDFSNKGMVGEIDCAPFPSLFHAQLSYNDLRKIRFAGNRWLTTADLADNKLRSLDLSANFNLEELRLGNNALEKLDLRGNPSLRYLDLRYNQFSSQELDMILTILVAHGEAGGTVLLNGGGNAAPTARGRGAAWVLSSRSWIVQSNIDRDYDQDGLPDAWEQEMFGGGHETADGDADGDGLTNLRERLHYLDPTKADTDADGYSDGVELSSDADPGDPTDFPPPTGQVTGVVWNDPNRNFNRDAGESGIRGIDVFLETGRGPQRKTSRTKTEIDGSYRFSALPSADYSVSILLNDWKTKGPTIKTATLTHEDDQREIDFALIDPSVIFSQWEDQFFGDKPMNPRGDPDGDGYPNLLEYALGTHPLLANGRSSEQISSTTAVEGFRFAMQYRVNPNAVNARTIAETYRNGGWQAVKETSGWSGLSRQASILVQNGEVGLLRLRARLDDDLNTEVHGPCWGGHAFVLDQGLRVSGLPLVNKRILGGRVLANDGNSVTLSEFDTPLAELIGPERAYMEVQEGPFEGERWEVASDQPWPGRLALAVNHAANTRFGPLPNLAGRKVVVRPHLTLGQVFGRAGQDVNQPFSVNETDRLWFLESGRLAPYHIAASDDGEQTFGWSRWGDRARTWDDRPIFPGEGFFARRSDPQGIAFLLLGEVRLNRMIMQLKAGPNFIAPSTPFRQSFAGLGLSPFGNFTANALPEAADQAFIWNGNEFDPYFFFGDPYQGLRWVRSNDEKRIDQSNSPLICGDHGFILDLIESQRLYTPSFMR